MASCASDTPGLPRPPQPAPVACCECRVGTILIFINQADIVSSGEATKATWIRIGLSYMVPFAVSNYGELIGSRRSGPD